MPKADSEILEAVVNEWRSGSGGSLVIRAVLDMLQNLGKVYGERFSIDSACEALDDLAQNAGRIKKNLQSEKTKKSSSK